LNRLIAISFFWGLLLYGAPSHIFGQEYSRGLSLNVGYGTLVAHRNSMQHLVTGNSWYGDLNYALRTDGSRPSHRLYRYPWYGVGFNLLSSGNPSQIGEVGGAYGFGNLPLSKGKLPLSFKIGLGIGIVQLPFDLSSNFQAIAIGSRVNCNILFRLEKSFNILDASNISHQLKLGFGLTHFSNAAFQTPNLGLNFVHLHLGYQLRYKPELFIENNEEIGLRDVQQTFSVVGGIGARENAQPTLSKFAIYQTKLQFEHYFGFKHSAYISADFTFNESLKAIGKPLFQQGIFVGYFLNFDQLRIGTGMGIYTYNRSFPDQPLYHKLIIEYLFSTRLALQLSMRTHWATADFVSLNLRYAIWKK
jgi:hypothetical protein